MKDMQIQSFEQYQRYALKTLSTEFHLQIRSELIHAIMGIVTEVTEMTEALQCEDLVLIDPITGDVSRFGNLTKAASASAVLTVDMVNFTEEIGDALWYVAVAYHFAGIPSSALPLQSGIGGKFPDVTISDLDIGAEMVKELSLISGNALDICKKSMFYGRKPHMSHLRDLIIACGEHLLLLSEWAGCDLGAIATVNINKLRQRFPTTFKAEDANNRDLDKERKVLETINEGAGDESDG